LPLAHHKGGAQGFMALYDHIDALLEGVDIQWAANANRIE
jgi:hypothetical protein